VSGHVRTLSEKNLSIPWLDPGSSPSCGIACPLGCALVVLFMFKTPEYHGFIWANVKETMGIHGALIKRERLIHDMGEQRPALATGLNLPGCQGNHGSNMVLGLFDGIMRVEWQFNIWF